MARRPQPEYVPVYAAAQQFVDRSLARDDSLFSPGRSIWSSAVLDDLHARFVEQPIETPEPFMVKFERQLAGAPDATLLLAAECLFVYFLMPINIKGETKRTAIKTVLKWMKEPVTIPSDLAEALDVGLATVGIAYQTYRPFQLQFLIALARSWKALDDDRRAAALADPWAFRDVAYDVPVPPGSQAMRESLLHLVHPDTFEGITARDMKQRIADAFAVYVTHPEGNVDEQLAEIRGRLTEEFGSGFVFWDERIRPRWQPDDANRWGEFVQWARRFYDTPKFATDERDYKYKIGERFKEASDAAANNAPDWIALLRRAFGAPNNITFHITYTKFLEWAEALPDEARRALVAFWRPSNATGDTIDQRVKDLAAALPMNIVSGIGTRLNLITSLAMAIDIERFPPYRSNAFTKAYELTGFPKPPAGADEAATYRHALDFLDTLGREAADRGLALKDRLEGQSVVWCVTQWGPMPDWSPDVRNALVRYLGGSVVVEPGSGTDGDSNQDGTPSTLVELAERELLDPTYLAKIDRLLRSKRQVIFYGPPGTGKTYIARKLAAHYADGNPNAVELVQFHPSYAYEDFVEGFRPADINGTPGFRLTHGPLRRIATAASHDTSRLHVLIIDEVNRANVAKVFGELYFLLEYRTEDISLQYSPDQRFKLPENLLIIGTMNSADRSIALVDAALRRRFYFVPFFPDEPPIQDLLRRWLGRHKPDYLWLADVVDRMNARLDRNLAVGPSHFLRTDLDDNWIALIWEHAVLPYLSEQFIEDDTALSEFALDRLKASVSADGIALAPRSGAVQDGEQDDDANAEAS